METKIWYTGSKNFCLLWGGKISVLSEINGNYVVVIKDIKIGLAKEYVKRIIVA